MPPLAARPLEPQDRVHGVAHRNHALDAAVDRWVEQVLDKCPLVVRQLDHRANARSLPAPRVRLNCTDTGFVREQSATGSQSRPDTRVCENRRK